MTKLKSCIIIAWDGKFSVQALKVKRLSDSKLIIQENIFSRGASEDLPIRLMQTYTQLNPPSVQTILLSANTNGAFGIDVKIPKMPVHEIKNALGFELQRQIPVPVENLTWAYRVAETLPKHFVIRVFAIKTEVWEKILAILLDSGIRIDGFVHPIFLADISPSLRLDELNDFFALAMADFSADIPTNNPHSDTVKELFLETISPLEDKTNKDMGTLLCCFLAHTIMKKNRVGNISIFQLPKHLKPVRFKLLKTSFLFLLSLNVFLVGLLCLRQSANSRYRLAELENEKSKIDAELLKIADEYAKYKRLDEFMKKISEADPGNSEIVLALLTLTQNLPPHIWISSFNARGREFDLSISTNDDKSIQTELSKLNSLPEFSNVSIKNSRRERDGALTVYLKLNHNKTK